MFDPPGTAPRAAVERGMARSSFLQGRVLEHGTDPLSQILLLRLPILPLIRASIYVSMAIPLHGNYAQRDREDTGGNQPKSISKVVQE
jgi:hypothetical protein